MIGFVIIQILTFTISRREFHIPLQASALLKEDDVIALPVTLNATIKNWK